MTLPKAYHFNSQAFKDGKAQVHDAVMALEDAEKLLTAAGMGVLAEDFTKVKQTLQEHYNKLLWWERTAKEILRMETE